MTKLIVGFAGEMSAGKGTATELMKRWYPNTPSFRFSDSLREFYAWIRSDLITSYPLLAGLKEDASTEQLQELSTKIRELFGENALERAIIARVARLPEETPNVIIEGIRRLVDITTLMNDPTVKFRLVYIEAHAPIRYQRHIVRNEKPGDNTLSFAQFRTLGNAEAEAQIRLLRPHAHAIIDNSGGEAAFAFHLESVLNLWVTS